MAIETKDEVSEALIKVSVFFKKWEGKVSLFDEILKDLKGLRYELVTLQNQKESLEVQNRDAQAKLDRARAEATTRLQNTEQSNRAIMERITKKEVDLDAAVSQLKQREENSNRVRIEAEQTKAAYELLLAEAKAGKSKK